MELLERLKYITGSEFISDLSLNCYITFYQFHKIKEINVEEYSLKEWNEAVHYISHENKNFNNKKDARSYICTVLSEK